MYSVLWAILHIYIYIYIYLHIYVCICSIAHKNKYIPKDFLYIKDFLGCTHFYGQYICSIAHKNKYIPNNFL